MLTRADVSRLRSLRDKKDRDALGLFVVEGEKVVGELLATHFPLVELYATAEWAGQRAVLLPDLRLVTHEEMARISHYPTPSTVLALGKIERPPFTATALAQGLSLALDGIQDAGNLGTLLRVADWFAFDRVLASLDCVDYFNQKVINASMGSFSRVPFFSVTLGETLARSPVPVLGCELAGNDVHQLPPLTDAVVVIGSEGRGLSSETRAHVTHFVTIPRYGGAESLNAGVAAAIVCDNLRRVASPRRAAMQGESGSRGQESGEGTTHGKVS
jgi:TrmH family RNA methyltransferase